MAHTHECRDCGDTIFCFENDETCDWQGGNDGCDCAGEDDR